MGSLPTQPSRQWLLGSMGRHADNLWWAWWNKSEWSHLFNRGKVLILGAHPSVLSVGDRSNLLLRLS